MQTFNFRNFFFFFMLKGVLWSLMKPIEGAGQGDLASILRVSYFKSKTYIIMTNRHNRTAREWETCNFHIE